MSLVNSCGCSPVSPCRGERRVQPPSEVGVLRAGAEHEAQGEVGDDGQGQRVEGRQGDLKEHKTDRVDKSLLDIQGTSRRLFPGCVKLGEKVALCLPTAGRRTQFFHPIFTQPGKHSLEVPCTSIISG